MTSFQQSAIPGSLQVRPESTQRQSIREHRQFIETSKPLTLFGARPDTLNVCQSEMEGGRRLSGAERILRCRSDKLVRCYDVEAPKGPTDVTTAYTYCAIDMLGTDGASPR
jgi:hypothetical protein